MPTTLGLIPFLHNGPVGTVAGGLLFLMLAVVLTRAGRKTACVEPLLAARRLFSSAAPAAAQAPDRIATTAEALVANPLFFHGKRIVVRHAVRAGGSARPSSTATAKPVFVFWKDRAGGIGRRDPRRVL